MAAEVNVRRITVTALMAALVFVLTSIPRIPVPATGGYLHLGDVAIAFAAFAFGPSVAMAAGAMGTGLADLLGFPQWAIFSVLVHGFQGWAMASLVRRGVTPLSAALSILVGTLIVVAGYFLAGVVLEGPAVAALELVPNLIQGGSGWLIGLPLYLAVRLAYPAIDRGKVSHA